MSWRTTLYEYVHHRNQMELDYSVDPLLPFVQDTAFLQRQHTQLTRRAESDRDRKLVPVKCETRLVIDRVSELPEHTVAEVTLKRTQFGRIRETVHEERRIEKERLILLADSDGWSISRIEALRTEQALRLRPAAPGAWLEAEDDGSSFDYMRAPSVPFLNRDMIPEWPNAVARAVYNRYAAAFYADLWWDKENPAFLTFEVDCTNYVSQCLFAGGAPMNYTGKRDSGWWYKGRAGGQELWSFSWSVANSLPFYLLTSRRGLRGQEVFAPQDLDIGDCISYDWDGNGRFQHSTVVTAKDANGMPLVNAHTISSKHRYWSYTDSHAWTERTRYRFIHIADSL
ncbi:MULTISPECIES: amidase domain-containing protein [Paenibacillus]|uniref:amidase domain-containing protein n=1 Tax=Paenibacillus TaxID=44249 RepID=UPI001141E4CE|nr:amidase domain-containing protein [Paenibacillus sp. tmac-D7]